MFIKIVYIILLYLRIKKVSVQSRTLNGKGNSNQLPCLLPQNSIFAVSPFHFNL